MVEVVCMALIQSCRGVRPRIHPQVFLAENVSIIGDVEIEEGCSIWYNVTIRGDVMPIRIGRQTNIQDGSIIHGTYGKYGVQIGPRVTIGHGVILHGCQIGAETLIGMGSILMDGVQVEENSIVGAGSLLTEGSHFKSRSLIIGRPAQFKRELRAEEIASLSLSADNYLLYQSWYKEVENKTK